MTLTKFDYSTFFYKMFLLILLTTQIFALYFQVVTMYTLIINGIMSIYLIFRFYLLNKLKNRAGRLSLTLPEFLIKRSRI